MPEDRVHISLTPDRDHVTRLFHLTRKTVAGASGSRHEHPVASVPCLDSTSEFPIDLLSLSATGATIPGVGRLDPDNAAEGADGRGLGPGTGI